VTQKKVQSKESRFVMPISRGICTDKATQKEREEKDASPSADGSA